MDYELHRLKAQVAVLKDIAKEYGTCTITNAIMQLESRIKHIEQNNK